MEKPLANCGMCSVPYGERYCRVEKGKGPKDCPSLHYKKMGQQAFDSTPEAEREFVRQAAIQEARGYHFRPEFKDTMPAKPRIVEIVEFARRMQYRKLGLIFCIGLRDEANVTQQILMTNGFTVASASCKVGKQPKTAYGIKVEDFVNPSLPEESACNPKFQALLMNEAQVDFTILMGLCVGHDTLALKHLEAPVTILAVKDRLLGHNPLAAIYNYDSYYAYLKKPLP